MTTQNEAGVRELIDKVNALTAAVKEVKDENARLAGQLNKAGTGGMTRCFHGGKVSTAAARKLIGKPGTPHAGKELYGCDYRYRDEGIEADRDLDDEDLRSCFEHARDVAVPV